MFSIEEMNKWNYAEAWTFFSNNALGQYIPESKIYVQSLKISETKDLRDDSDARNKILESIQARTLVFIDGSSLNGKSTFAERLARTIKAEIVDIDMICKDWLDQQLKRKRSMFERSLFLANADILTDKYILDNLERIIKEKSKKTVIFVGSYMELLYRSIIAKVFGKYFEKVVSIYCCAKTFDQVKMMFIKREETFGTTIPNMEQEIFKEYETSKRLLEFNGLMLGIGMDASFIADINVSDMFV